jgi:hypothetical protein
MRIPRAVRHDIGLKIAALALALFLWATVAERREVELIVEVPLRYTDMPSDMVFADQVPEYAKARIQGRGRFLRWRLEDVCFSINLSAAEEGIVTHVVSEGEFESPPDKEIEVLDVIEPKAIRVELDKLITRKLPPMINLRGDMPGDKVMIGKPWAEPAEIVIAGAESILDTLTAVFTEEVDLGQLAKKGRVVTKTVLSGLPFVTVDVEEVTIAARIEPKKELGIPSVPIEAVSRTGAKARFTPDSLDVVIAGAESHVDSLDPQDLRLLVNVTNLPKGQLTFTPMIKEGGLYFEVRSTGKDEEEQVFEIKARLEAPHLFELLSASPEQIGFVQR